MHVVGSLERKLIELAWTDKPFAKLAVSEPKRALAQIGVETDPDVEIEIIVQDRNTLYYVIPPLAESISEADAIVDQMDLWQSAELFCWIMPQDLKLQLLAMRQSFRRNQGE